jgi:hypothetical protein
MLFAKKTNVPMCILVEKCPTIGRSSINYFGKMATIQGLD